LQNKAGMEKCQKANAMPDFLNANYSANQHGQLFRSKLQLIFANMFAVWFPSYDYPDV
jgi:hypothetical protein